MNYYDILFAKKLAGEGGGGNGGLLIVHANPETFTLDKTWQEIYDAELTFVVAEDIISNGKAFEVYTLAEVSIGEGDGKYYVILDDESDPVFIASSPNEYPVYRPTEGSSGTD